MPRVRVHLDTPSGLVPLPSGSYVIGREAGCDIVIDSGRASRRHARLVVTPTGATLEDLTTVNGTFVNGAPVTGAQALAHMDFIVVGDVALEITFETVGPTEPEIEWPVPTHSERPQHPSQRLATAPAKAFEMLEGTAEPFFAAGQPDLAERTLEGWLSRVLSAIKTGAPREVEGDAAALRSAVKLCVVLGTPRWVDYCVELCTLLGWPLSAVDVDALERVVAQVGVSSTLLEAYALRLASLPPSGDAQRVLARLAAWQRFAVAR